MKFGLAFFPDSGPEQMSGEEYFRDSLDLCQEADELGFESVRIVEHYMHPYGGYSPNPSIFLAAAAQRTKRIRLVTGCVLPAFTHPVKLASELAMLDAISGGRLDVGFARAFLPHEFETFGVPMEESNARFREGMEAVKRLWTEEKVTFEGQVYRFNNVTILPRPTQKPHPPMWVAAIQTAESFEWAGKNGYNLMVVPYLSDFEDLREKIGLYRAAYEQAGHGKVKPDQIVMMLHTFVRANDQQAIEEAKPHMEHYVKTFLHSAVAWDSTTSSQYKGYNKLADMLRQMTFEKVLLEKRAAIGSPETVSERFKEIAEFFGVHYFTLQVNFGVMTYEKAVKSVRLFAKEVLPYLRVR